MLLLPYRDLTGGFKAWRRELLEAIRLRETLRLGLWLPDRDDLVGAPARREDRRRSRSSSASGSAGTSKMTGGIVREAMLLVVRLRLGAIRDAISPSGELAMRGAPESIG